MDCTLPTTAARRKTRIQEPALLSLVPPEVQPNRDLAAGGGLGRTSVRALPGHRDVHELLVRLRALAFAPATPPVELERIRWQLALAVRRHVTDDRGAAA